MDEQHGECHCHHVICGYVCVYACVCVCVCVCGYMSRQTANWETTHKTNAHSLKWYLEKWHRVNGWCVTCTEPFIIYIPFCNYYPVMVGPDWKYIQAGRSEILVFRDTKLCGTVQLWQNANNTPELAGQINIIYMGTKRTATPEWTNDTNDVNIWWMQVWYCFVT